MFGKILPRVWPRRCAQSCRYDLTFSEINPGYTHTSSSFRWWCHSDSPVVRLDDHVTSTHLVLRIILAGT
jgi:hypothetical protein